MYVDSELDVGSKFTFTMCIEKPLMEPKCLGAEEASDDNQTNKILFALSNKTSMNFMEVQDTMRFSKIGIHKRMVLVVDDQSFNLRAMSTILKNIFNIDTYNTCFFALNGLDAFDVVKQKIDQNGYNPFDLIFMDLNMPIMDGHATTAIRELMDTYS